MTNEKERFHIIMLANGHPVFDTRIFVKEARSLTAAGYKVALIIPHDRDEIKDGVTILSVQKTTKGWEKLLVSPWRIFWRAFKQSSRAVYHIHDSDILIVGVLLKLLGRKVIYDAHEDTPLQISYQHWIPSFAKKPYAWFYYLLEKVCGWMFDRIIVAEPVIAKYFPEKKTFLIRNFPMVSAFRSHVQPKYQDRKMRLIHMGTLSKVRGLFEMLEASKAAQQKLDFELYLGGKFAPAELKEKVINNYTVTFSEWVSYTDLVDLLYNSRIGIMIANPIERYKTNYPVKLFEFMAAGIPVISSKEGESAEFVNESNSGLLVNPMDTAEISQAITWLFEHPKEAEEMGKRGQEMIFNKYNWEAESERLVQMYSQLVKVPEL